jgi:uncharacterized membrane protein
VADDRSRPNTVVLGLLVAPGLASDLAKDLAETLPEQLSARFEEVDWDVEVRVEPKVGAAAGPNADLVRVARRRMLDEGWDLIVCLTDLPVLVNRRPVTAHASATHGVGLVSVPALGAVAVDTRVREAVLRLLDGLLGERFGRQERRPSGRRRSRMLSRLREITSPIGHVERQESGTVRFVGEVVRGNLRLLVGMVRANRPWKLVAGLSRALIAALGAGAFGIVSTGVWHVAEGLSWVRLIALCLAAAAATCVALIVAHNLWERSPSPQARERVVLFNLATTATIVIGVLTLFVVLLALSTACAAAIIDRGVLAAEYGHPVRFEHYVRIGLVLGMLATIGGGLGSALESDDVVREAAYGYRPDDDGDGDDG